MKIGYGNQDIIYASKSKKIFIVMIMKIYLSLIDLRGACQFEHEDLWYFTSKYWEFKYTRHKMSPQKFLIIHNLKNTYSNQFQES